MNLDVPTLLAASLVATGLMAGAHLVVWAQDRRETAIPWMVAATGLGCVGAFLRDALPPTAAILLANVALLLGLSCIATACRVLEHRSPSGLGLLGPAAVWLAACAVPAVLGSQSLRIVLASGMSGLLMAWAVIELWRGRRERLVARSGLIAVLGLNGLAAVARAATTVLTAGPVPQPGLVKGADLALVTLWSLGFVLLSGFGVILFVKERAERRLREAAGRDALTGLANRGRFDETLDLACRRAARSGRPLSLLMVDVDAFKAYNDLSGHIAGDGMLRAVANVLAATAARGGGLAARYGGEEFALILPDADAEAARRLADAARTGVRALAIPHPGSDHGRLTISVGIATTGGEVGTQAWDLLRAADAGLYAAKHAGRDSVRHESPGATASRSAA